MRTRFHIPALAECYAPEPGSAAAEYMSRSMEKMNRFRARRNIRRWDDEALLKAYSWAGHIARMAKYNVERLAHKVLAYRDARYLNTLKTMYGHQCHGQRFHVWRWEQQFSMVFTQDWRQKAQMGETWEDLREHWLTTRKRRMKTVDNSFFYDD